MLFKNVCVEAVGYHLPENIVTSEALEKRMQSLYQRLKLPFGRLEMMSGIRERRFWREGIVPSQVASIAGENAIRESGWDRSRIGCLISASVCRDFLEPATASMVHDNLKLSGSSQVFDISNACLGVLNGMIHVSNMIDCGQIEAGLIVAGENGGPLVNNTIQGLVGNLFCNWNGIGIKSAAGIDRHITALADYMIKRAAVYHKILDQFKGPGPEWFNN